MAKTGLVVCMILYIITSSQIGRLSSDSRQHPHLTPSSTWSSLFTSGKTSDTLSTSSVTNSSELERTETDHDTFVPSPLPAHKQILKTLGEHEAGSVTIVAIGPLTNLALAAAEDVETFLRVKEVVYMGGAIGVPGNVSLLFMQAS
jgi:inosine-uridine nucleoside N-ribohydrolase